MSIKRLNPKAHAELVSLTDPAVDEEKSDLDEYRKTVDISHLKFKEGMEPTYFLVKNISPEDDVDVRDAHMVFDPNAKDPKDRVKFEKMNRMFVRYFRACVSEIRDGGKVEKVSADDFSSAIISEIGTYAFIRTQVGVAEKKP